MQGSGRCPLAIRSLKRFYAIALNKPLGSLVWLEDKDGTVHLHEFDDCDRPIRIVPHGTLKLSPRSTTEASTLKEG